MKHTLYIGDTAVRTEPAFIRGAFVTLEGEDFYRISNYDQMPPFFMTMVSSTDQWLFIGSNGGLTAGRKNPESALFPYYTDDKIIDTATMTGSKTLLRVKRNGRWQLWEPFSDRYLGAYATTRNIYKNKTGNKIVFEEINADLGLSYRYQWNFADEYGFVKRSELENTTDQSTEVELVDGFQNLLPAGVNSRLQNDRSTLVDAYKKSELEANGLALFSLSAMIVDRAEPSEALLTTTVWSAGLAVDHYLLSNNQLEDFRRGSAIEEETEMKATKGAYFINRSLSLPAGDRQQWVIVAEVNQDHSAVIALQQQLEQPEALLAALNENVAAGTIALRQLVGYSDGLQLTADKLITSRHYSNVLFNIMRGGIFADGYTVDVADLARYLEQVNAQVSARAHDFLLSLPTSIAYQELLAQVRQQDDAALTRICTEYLPLSFSRRHGDPSRPWNYFTIDTADENGHRKLNYEGNWRDIFQNWEALAYSFPAFIEGMITKFLNASTIDGYNPYRITRAGVDWEVIEPDDPWSYIGYWGDHQIIYLQKLLEHAEAHYPGLLASRMNAKEYVYANVPYRIRSYAATLQNASDTIDFDHELEHRIQERVAERGSDGKLVWTNDRQPLRATLAEKLLVSSLTKLYNYVPGAGLWLNTQRPEWNDANNALVGNGVSMVTLYYLRRHLQFVSRLLAKSEGEPLTVHTPVAQLLRAVKTAFQSEADTWAGRSTPAGRKQMMDTLGKAGETYRQAAYASLHTETQPLPIAEVQELLSATLTVIDDTIRHNRRKDGLYHAYNLLAISGEEVSISHLYEMLEGQVAVLSAGVLDTHEVVSLLNALKASAMYREDQYSYMLYPDRALPTFLQKNRPDGQRLADSKLVKKLVAAGNTSLLEADLHGHYHFNGSLRNAAVVRQTLQDLADAGYEAEVAADQALILDEFEQVFNHRAFTGRSGTFFGYEGLGSIYWHMVSKLLLAVQENLRWGRERGADTVAMGSLIDHYYEIRAGIGVNKSPELYGAFPTDAYSHTPGNAGAQQPGMTGQVKEDVINRWAELGLVVDGGTLYIDPFFLHSEEFRERAAAFDYVNAVGDWEVHEVAADELAFTYCGVLFVYRRAESIGLHIHYHNGSQESTDEARLAPAIAATLFGRAGKIKQITVRIPLE